jgi:hypothetical protein
VEFLSAAAFLSTKRSRGSDVRSAYDIHLDPHDCCIVETSTVPLSSKFVGRISPFYEWLPWEQLDVALDFADGAMADIRVTI